MYALIVEPQPRRAHLLVAAAEAEGLDPAVARSDDEARAILAARGPPAACVLELTVANVDGFRLLSELRAYTPRVPAVVVSAFAELRDTAWKQRHALCIAVVLSTDLELAPVRHALRTALGQVTPPHRHPDSDVDPRREARRRARLHATHLTLTKNPAGQLDALMAEVVEAWEVDAAMCVVVDEHETLIAHAGLRGRVTLEPRTTRELGIARHVVDAVGGEALVVLDAANHPTFSQNALVREGVVRAFVGLPLEATDGTVFGAVCLLHGGELALSHEEVHALHRFAGRVSGELEVLRSHGGRAAREDLQFAVHHLSAVLEHLEHPVALWDVHHRLMLANPALAQRLGREASDLVRMNRAGFCEVLGMHVDDPGFVEMVRGLPAAPTLLSEEVELGGRVYRWSTKPLELPGGHGQLDVWLDVTAEKELSRAALTDSLTGLANRRGAEAFIRRELARAQRTGAPLAFLLVDIDHFKRVNDTLGHAEGDRVIREVSQCLRRTLRGSDVAARWGGEEFLCVLPETELTAARATAERVRLAVQGASWPADCVVTVSIGSAQLAAGENPEAAIGRADAALYVAKDGGRNRVA